MHVSVPGTMEEGPKELSEARGERHRRVEVGVAEAIGPRCGGRRASSSSVVYGGRPAALPAAVEVGSEGCPLDRIESRAIGKGVLQPKDVFPQGDALGGGRQPRQGLCDGAVLQQSASGVGRALLWLAAVRWLAVGLNGRERGSATCRQGRVQCARAAWSEEGSPRRRGPTHKRAQGA